MTIWSSRKKKKTFFVPFILSEVCIELNTCIEWCIELNLRNYWIDFQNIHTFKYQKTLLHTLFCLLLKSSKAFSVSLFEKNSVQKFLLFFTRFPKKCYDDIWVLFEKCLDQTFPSDRNLGKNVLRAFPISIWNSFN